MSNLFLCPLQNGCPKVEDYRSGQWYSKIRKFRFQGGVTYPLNKTCEFFFFRFKTECFSRLNRISNGFKRSVFFFFSAVCLAKFALRFVFTIILFSRSKSKRKLQSFQIFTEFLLNSHSPLKNSHEVPNLCFQNKIKVTKP